MGDSVKLHPDLEALIGAVVHDRYRVESLLGAGGMGAVFKARHTGLERDVAIKVLHPEIGRDESVSKRFDREATSASRLDHPNCVRVTDFGTTDKGTKYLVMELLEGGELLDRLGAPWGPEAMIVTAKQVLAGLEHAHHFGIVHRDLKPENVFITQDFRGEELVKLVDFGIAKLIDEQGAEKLTRAGIVFGTPRYMSPEQAAGGKIDARTDLYAAGLIFYEMLAGRAPFDSDDAAQLLRMQIMAPPAPLPESVPAPLAAVVEKLLEKSKMDRYASAREVIDALDEARAAIAAGELGPASAGAAAAAAGVSAPTSALELPSPAPNQPGVGSGVGSGEPSPSTAGAARSGAAWQPAAPPVRSGATVASSAAASVEAPGTGRTLAYTSSGSHPTVPSSHGQTTGSHPGIGQPATGPFDNLTAASPPVPEQGAAPAAWTSSHPALGGAQQQPVSGAYPSLASQSVPIGTGGYAALPEHQPRRAWLPWAIAGVALLLAVGAVGFAMTRSGDEGDEGDAQTRGEASEQPAPAQDEPAAAQEEGAKEARAAGVEAGDAGAPGAGRADPPAPGPTRTDKSIWSSFNRDEREAEAEAEDGAGAGASKKKPSREGGSASGADSPTGEPDASGDTTPEDSSADGSEPHQGPHTTEEEKRAEQEREAAQKREQQKKEEEIKKKEKEKEKEKEKRGKDRGKGKGKDAGDPQ